MTDTHQFEVFMRAYQDMVYTTAVRLLGNEAEAEDISQEVFLKAYERFDELSQSPTVGGWLKTVANFRKTRFRGIERTQLAAHLDGAAYNLLRIAKLTAAPA